MMTIDPRAASAEGNQDNAEHFDVLIVGAGLSGIGVAAHLQQQCPDKRYAILEARSDLGGTWDLFRYPGIRSDSDMHTLGYTFKPWRHSKAIADGASIKAYIAETAGERGIEDAIRYNHRVVRADWDSAQAVWTLEVERADGRAFLTANFVTMCSGYYAYDEGHRPTWPEEERFGGRFVHPQFWPEDLDYAGKHIVVIGSGATAVTLIPELARDAAHVTMLQRSPSYVVSRPSVDPIAEKLKRWLPAKAAYRMTRWKNVLLGQYFFSLARKQPVKVKKLLIDGVQAQLGPDYDVARHFTPTYNPWDQRVCAVPDGDFFRMVKRGRASVVTDTITGFEQDGIRLASGETLAADIVVTATGLKLQMLGGARISVDGVPVELPQKLSYRGCMFSDVPNLVMVFGYTNASWTLKADLVSAYVCRLLKRMDARGTPIATPRPEPSLIPEPFLDFQSGYVQRSAAVLPKQGSKRPWKLFQNYTLDMLSLRLGRIDDGTLKFGKPPSRADCTALQSKAA
jgi:monooxygenase